MRRCPITYEPLAEEEPDFSAQGLRRLARNLERLERLPFSSSDLIKEAAQRADKMSIGGVQPKLSARLSPAHGAFRIVDSGGNFILKPENPTYDFVPQNEDLTMRLAAIASIEVPLHGMIYTDKGELCYFVKRFDRFGAKGKLAMEDFGQLAGLTRDTKYNFSLEKVGAVLQDRCSFPAIESVKLFRRIVFSFLCGNEDMHVKNYSLITDRSRVVKLSPAYDLLNSSIIIDPQEESALSLRGKKSNLQADDFLEYLALGRLRLTAASVAQVMNDFEQAIPEWLRLLEDSFLPDSHQAAYRDVLSERTARLNLDVSSMVRED